MIQLDTRRAARGLTRAAATFSAAILMVSTGSASTAAAAGINAGSLQVVVPPGTAGDGQPLAAGGSATPFALVPPAGASCTGDSATDGYRVQSYMVPASVDPSTLTFDSTGPVPQGSGAGLRMPLFSSTETPFVDATTALATTPGGGGLLTGLPPFSFSAFGANGPAFVPAGTYNVGIACTLGNASATQQDRFWNVPISIVVDPTDAPSGITWSLADAPPTAATTTGSASTTSLQTSTEAASGSGTTRLISTGWSPFRVFVWAIILIAFGRIAILVARRTQVDTPER
jgi:hypothetical protein